MDCAYEMGTNGEMCAWAPGACKSWCRSNTASWVPTVLDIADEINTSSYRSFAVYIDTLKPTMLNAIFGDDLVSSVLRDLNPPFDGTFGVGGGRDELEVSGVKCRIVLNGLDLKPFDRTIYPPEDVVEAWDSWSEIKAPWFGRARIYARNKDGIYTVEESGTRKRYLGRTNDGIVADMCAYIGDDLADTRFARATVSYDFTCRTHAWNRQRRGALSGVLDAISDTHPELLKKVSDSGVLYWAFSPMGPKASPFGGNIHVSMQRPPPHGGKRSIAWGSSKACVIYMDDPKSDPSFSPVQLRLLTSW